MNNVITLDLQLLEARIFHSLKGILSTDDTISNRALEYIICEAFSFKHVGDGNFYADGIKDDIQASIKTRKLEPIRRKRVSGRNFQTNPSEFLGHRTNETQKIVWDGIEIVQRRQALDFDETTATPAAIGLAALKGFEDNVNDSCRKFNTPNSVEIIGIHGYNHRDDLYIMSLFWDDYNFLDPNTLNWVRNGNTVNGYDTSTNRIVAARVDGNAKRESTCFKEYKNLTKYTCTAKIELPIPEQWKFDKDEILDEITNLRNKNAPPDLFEY